ncbi:MAG: Gfo/Idh/MocA family oxidoreductase [Anaerolineae bacterium]|nr:Gfo/Idh/MocA family oxidoreductase [Anaerolineae bacterium]
MLKMAVVGVGSMGRNHFRVLSDTPGVELVGIADPDLQSANAVVRKSGVPVYADYRRLFDQVQPAAIVIAVPTQFHRDVAMAAIERGIHVLVEKPIAATIEQAEEMIDAAEQRNVVLAVGHIERFNPAVLELKRRIEAGELGRIFMIHSRRESPYPRRITDVGVAKDLSTHELDMMRYLVGSRVVRLNAEVSYVMNSPYEDIVFSLLRFENGVIGVLDVNWVTPTTVREISITGEKGMFVVNYLSQEIFFHENPAAVGVMDGAVWLPGQPFSVEAGHMTRFQINRREPLRSELESFIQAVQNNEKPLVDGHDGLEALRLALQIIACSQPNSA